MAYWRLGSHRSCKLEKLVSHDLARRLGYTAVCLTCESPIAADERAYREHGVGAWHADCDAPRNLKLYRRERDRAPKRPPRSRDFYDIDD